MLVVDKTIMLAADVLSDKVRAFQLDQEASKFLQNASNPSSSTTSARHTPFIAISASRGVCCTLWARQANLSFQSKVTWNVHTILMRSPALLYHCDRP